MFWNTALASPNIETILEQPDVTLEQVLDLDEILQECRAANRKLLEYLQRSTSLHQMLDYVTKEPDPDLPFATQYKYANVSCEVLTSDISFAEKLAADRSCLEKMCNFFKDNKPPLNPLLASYVCRILSELIIRKPDQNWYSYKLITIQLLGYLTEPENDVLKSLTIHIGTSSVCDLIYKLIMNIEGPDTRTTMLQWLEKNNFAVKLVRKMRPGEKDVHESIDRLVNDLLDAFRDDMSSSNQDRNSNADPFMLALKKCNTVEVLFGAILTDPICESSIKYGLNVAVALMGIHRRPPRPTQQKSWVPIYENHDEVDVDIEVQLLVSIYFQKLKTILIKKPNEVINLPFGVQRHPIGTTRLSVLRFFAHMTSLRIPEYINVMASQGIIKAAVEMIWENRHNGFVYREVERMLLNIILMKRKNEGFYYVLNELKIFERIMSEFERPEKFSHKGHLARFACAYIEVTSKPGFQQDVANKFEAENEEVSNKWKTFLNDVLEPYLQRERILLGGVMVPHSGSQVDSQAVTEELENFNDVNSWGDLKGAADITHDDFGVFSETNDNAKDMFEMYCSAKENGIEAPGLSEGFDAFEATESPQFEDEEWGNSESVINELSLKFT